MTKTSKLLRFLRKTAIGLSVLVAIVAVYMLWWRYVPSVAHRPWCADKSIEFSTHLTPEYINLVGNYVSENWTEKEHELSLGTSGYYIVYKDELYLTQYDESGDGLLNLLNKAPASLLVRNVKTSSFEVPPLTPDSTENVKLYWKWENAWNAMIKSSIHGTPQESDAANEAFNRVQCEVLLKVSQKKEQIIIPLPGSPPKDTQQPGQVAQ